MSSFWLTGIISKVKGPGVAHVKVNQDEFPSSAPKTSIQEDSSGSSVLIPPPLKTPTLTGLLLHK